MIHLEIFDKQSLFQIKMLTFCTIALLCILFALGDLNLADIGIIFMNVFC